MNKETKNNQASAQLNEATTPVTDEQINEWKKKYNEVYLLTDENGKSYYMSKPSRHQYLRFLDGSSKKLSSALETLAVDCLLYPDMNEYQKLCTDNPALPSLLGTELLKNMGANQEFVSKKL